MPDLKKLTTKKKQTMQTAKQVQREIDKNLFILSTQQATKHKDQAKTQRQIDFLKTIILYLESEPREEFITSEIKRLESLKNKILEQCAKFKSKQSVANYKAIHDYSKINQQLKTLNFILC